jgi:hypothetical protein
MAVVVEATGQGSGGVLSTEVEEQLSGSGEEHAVSGEDGLVGDVLSEHGFAEALSGDEDEIAALLEELEAESGFDGGAIDGGGPVPVEVGHRFEGADSGAGQATFKGSAGSFLLLGLDEVFEDLGGAPATLGGLGQEVVEMSGGVVKSQGLEEVSKRAAHRCSPTG